MDADADETGLPAQSLREILLGFLQANEVCTWPGSDGLTVDDVVGCYPAAIAVGKVPNWPELQRRYPTLTPEIQQMSSELADTLPGHWDALHVERTDTPTRTLR
jgi:hypothetical protein